MKSLKNVSLVKLFDFMMARNLIIESPVDPLKSVNF